MFRRYFDKYKTGSIKFTTYMGASLFNQQCFDQVFLKNLRLRQLIALGKVTRRSGALKDSLKPPLETTPLILIYSQLLPILCWVDERVQGR